MQRRRAAHQRISRVSQRYRQTATVTRQIAQLQREAQHVPHQEHQSAKQYKRTLTIPRRQKIHQIQEVS